MEAVLSVGDVLVLKSGVWLIDRTRTVYCVFYFKHFMPLYLLILFTECLMLEVRGRRERNGFIVSRA